MAAATASALPASSVVVSARLRALSRLRLVIVTALVVPVLLFVAVAWYLYQQSFADAGLKLDSVARIAQEHALKLFETNEMLLQRMLDLMGNDDDATLLARGAELHGQLRKMATGLPQLQGLFISGADARMLASSRVYPPRRDIDYSDREMFKVHRQQRDTLFVTEQLVSRATGEPFFDLSRRRDYADGSFGGVVSSSLHPEYLTNFYEELAAGLPGLRVAVLRADGRALARWPDGVDGAQANAGLVQRFEAGETSGEADGASTTDGTERLRVFRRLGSYPLYVVASMDRAVVLHSWTRQAGLIALIGIPTALGFAWMAWLALRHTRNELDAVQRLDEETSHRQRIELAMHQSQKLEAMGRLTGGVAHDFNNLLMVVSSNLYLHQRLRPDIAGNAQLAAIDRAVASGTKLTRQLLAFSRRQALLPERIDLHERLPELLELLRPLLGNSIELTSDVMPNTGPIEVDPAELELAMINLAVNARDAMPDGGRLTLTARNARDAELDGADGAYIVIEVADSGVGIEPAVLERAFEPFYTTKPVGRGTGLGLSQVQALCQSAGGSARIDSRPGTGTRVSLYFRRAEALIAPAVVEEAVVSAHLDCRVLLVEDNEAVADATRSLLESMGCAVIHAASGVAAREIIDAHPSAVDVVLSDIEMPGGVDGIELAMALRARYPQLPVILMTGYAGRLEQAVRQHLEVLPKPCSFATLADAIGKAVARCRAFRGATLRQAR